ncbi:MAG TPA: hypothetical protein VHX61_04630 [Rhizomicrobium sp.]|jgi:hypothetical protein|nr:hypothetical protein [Rhizomicrobium sp.]
MRKRHLAGIMICLVSLGPNAARAEQTVSNFLQTVEEPLDRERAETLLAGINSGFMQANTWLAETRHEAPMYCVPEELVFTEDQLLSLLKKGADEDPAMGDMKVPAALLAVMRKTFPCAAAPK